MLSFTLYIDPQNGKSIVCIVYFPRPLLLMTNDQKKKNRKNEKASNGSHYFLGIPLLVPIFH